MIPNIYSGNYKVLILFPLLLVVFFAFFIPNIKYGIDFTGGMLVTIEFDKKVNEFEIKNVMGKITTNYNLRSYESLTGFIVEIETPGEEKILKISNNYENSIKLEEEINSLEAELAYLRQRENESEKIKEKEILLNEKLKKLNEIYIESIELGNEILGKEEFGKEKENLNSVSEKVKRINEIYLICKDYWKEKFINEFKKLGEIKRYSLEEVSPSLSIYFINKVLSIAVVSIILMIILVILIFRLPLPSGIVLSGATADIVISLGFMGLFGIPLSLPTFTALMILIGLSLDTDMMLCLKVLKVGEGNPRERAYEALKTGFAMTTTTLAAFVSLFILGELTKISVYYQIGLIGTVGLIGDLIATWFLNAVLVLWYKESFLRE